MAVTAVSSPSVSLNAGAEWLMCVSVRDGNAATSAAVTVTVTDPDGVTTSPVADDLAPGVYRAAVYPDTPGRWVAHIAAAGLGAADFTAYVSGVVTAADMPDVDTLSDYLGAHSASDETLSGVLATEASAQRDVCDIPAAYPASLAEAVLRRCACNLERRSLPLAMTRGDADGGDPVALPANDPEVRRLEGPYRKLPVG